MHSYLHFSIVLVYLAHRWDPNQYYHSQPKWNWSLTIKCSLVSHPGHQLSYSCAEDTICVTLTGQNIKHKEIKLCLTIIHLIMKVTSINYWSPINTFLCLDRFETGPNLSSVAKKWNHWSITFNNFLWITLTRLTELETGPYKTAAVWPLISHLTNHPNKISWAQL